MIAALVFPLSLVMIVLTGTDLCTGSFMVRSPQQQKSTHSQK